MNESQNHNALKTCMRSVNTICKAKDKESTVNDSREAK